MSVKAIAFYLPQYHPIAENDAWWGEGFSEWRNVAQARPLFPGHYQPHVPTELGFYDLRIVDTQRAQAKLARAHGIHGFCYYFYWFNGRRVLERPLDQMRATPDIDFPFCVCWANENWTRRWDGLENEVLLAQKHSAEDDLAFIAEVLKLMADPRYIKVDGKPMLVIYRVDLFPDMRATAERWRAAAKAAGHPDLYLALVQFQKDQDPRPIGFDAAIEFPPHHFLGHENVVAPPPFFDSECDASTISYRRVVAQALDKPWPEFTWHRGVMPSWDNSPRRRQAPHIFVDSSPAGFHQWLYRVVQDTVTHCPPERRFVFINAWNEWGEGAHLEPDLRYGRAYLEATAAALRGDAVIAEKPKPATKARTAEPLPEDSEALWPATQTRERSLTALEREVRGQLLTIEELRQNAWDGSLKSAAKLVLNRAPRVKRVLKRVLHGR